MPSSIPVTLCRRPRDAALGGEFLSIRTGVTSSLASRRSTNSPLRTHLDWYRDCVHGCVRDKGLPVCAFVASCIWLSFAGARSVTAQQTEFSRASLDARVPIVAEHRYVVSVNLRPFLIPMRRDDVGRGRITWRKGADGEVAYELLVGSDPGRAPRRINQWGFVVEAARGVTTEVLGLMRRSREQGYDRARADIERGSDARLGFTAVRTTVDGQAASGGDVSAGLPADATFRDVERLLGELPAQPKRIRVLQVPPGAHPGFLAAATALMGSLRQHCAGFVEPRRPATRTSAVYVYDNAVFDLTARSCRHAPTLTVKGRRFDHVIEGQFELRERGGKDSTHRFDMAFGDEGPLVDVPVRAVFRPRWWIEVDLVLDDDAPW